MNALAHWSLRLVLVGMVKPFALMLLLNCRCTGLERRQIHRVRVHQLLGDGDNIGNEPVEKVQ